MKYFLLLYATGLKHSMFNYNEYKDCNGFAVPLLPSTTHKAHSYLFVTVDGLLQQHWSRKFDGSLITCAKSSMERISTNKNKNYCNCAKTMTQH